jgi:rsbT co-antagonist protein RsbR
MTGQAKEEGGGVAREIEELRRRVEAMERREAELSSRLSFYEQVLDTLPDHLIVKDGAQRILYANRAACEYRGVTPEAVLGKTEAELGWPSAATRAEQDAQVLGGTLVDIPAEVITRHDGADTKFHSVRVPLRDAQGEIGGVLSSARGIHEARRAEQHNEALLRIIPDMYFRFDRAGTFIDFSAGRGAETALPPALFLGKRVHDVLPDLAPRLMESAERALRTGEMVRYEYRIFKMGQWMDYEARVLASGPDDVLLLTRDISEEKRIRDEQQRLQEELLRLQEAMVTELSTPLIPISDEILVMPLIGSLDEKRAERLMDRLLGGVAGSGARVVIIDVTGMSSVTTQTAGSLIRCAQATQLLGATVLLTGLRADVAHTLVTMGVNLSGITTLGTLKAGIAHAMRRAFR